MTSIWRRSLAWHVYLRAFQERRSSKHGSWLNTLYTCPKRVLLPSPTLAIVFWVSSQALAAHGLGRWHGADTQAFCRMAHRKNVEQAGDAENHGRDRSKGANSNDPWARICVLDKLGKGPWNKFANSFKDAAVSIWFCSERGVLKKGRGCVLWPGQHRQMEIGFWLWQSTCWALAGQGLGTGCVSVDWDKLGSFCRQFHFSDLLCVKISSAFQCVALTQADKLWIWIWTVSTSESQSTHSSCGISVRECLEIGPELSMPRSRCQPCRGLWCFWQFSRCNVERVKISGEEAAW